MSIALKANPISATHGPKISKHFRFGGEKILQFLRRVTIAAHGKPSAGDLEATWRAAEWLVVKYQNVDAKYQFDFE